MTLTDADLALLGAYLDGSLADEQELFRLEERLARDPELAAALDANVRVDVLSRTLSAARRKAGPGAVLRPRPWRRRPGLIAGLAAAAGIAALLYFRPWAGSTRVSLIATGVSLEDYHRELGLRGADVNKVPAGTLRGSAPDSALVEVPVEDYLALVGPLQEGRLADALDGRYALVDAEFFVVGLRTPEPCSAVVLLVDGAGPVLGARGEGGQVAWPSGPWAPSSGRLETPGDHVLPRRSVLRGQAPYDPGFLVPIGAGRVTALIGSRTEPLDAPLEQALRATIAEVAGAGEEEARERLSARLRALGFEVQTRIVPERRSEGH
jgi:hypothetical protein